MSRLNVAEICKPLKPFQRRTVDHAFKHLFLTQDSTSRFLVADEVGLGKTLVARGIIAHAIDHLWEDVDRIDIVYVCSNQNIARANLPKLHMGEQESLRTASRLTLLIKELSGEQNGNSFLNNKLNFVSFTPSTSFKFGTTTGRWDEREVLYHLLKHHPATDGHTTALKNLLQGRIGNKEWWRWYLKERAPRLESSIVDRFEEALNRDSDLTSELSESLEYFKRYKSWYPDKARSARNQAIGKLRHLLAQVSLEILEPDLVILDEFQRFKNLLETSEDHQTEEAKLAQELFNYKYKGQLVRTLLLSATPYKPYTTNAEIGDEDHYEDFISTARFLFNGNESKVQNLQSSLANFGKSLKRVAESGDQKLDHALDCKHAVESSLLSIMARTERVPASKDRDSMVTEVRPTLSIDSNDIGQYVAAASLFDAVGDRDPLPMWKSAPYLAHFMTGYKFNDLLKEKIEQNELNQVVNALSQNSNDVLSVDSIRHLKTVNPVHAKLRYVVQHYLEETKLWRLLWLPPTVPYWSLEGPFKSVEPTTKTLMFSAWNVVPDAVSALISYEAERQMFRGGQVKSYDNPSLQQGQLLNFSQTSEGKRSSHGNLLMYLPCLPLSDLHPLDTQGRGRNVRERTKNKIKGLLAARGLLNQRRGPVDKDWIWVAPLLLDDGLRSFLRRWRDGELQHLDTQESDEAEHSTHFEDYLTDLIEFDISTLGRQPSDLLETLTDIALGSPAVLLARTLRAYGGVSDDTRRSVAFEIADAFRKLFNRPAVISLLRNLPQKRSRAHTNIPYWRLVLNYCRDGCLQAVLDEHWHLLWEQASWAPDTDPNNAARDCAHTLYKSIQPVPSRVHAHFFNRNGAEQLDNETLRIRTVFALRFGHLTSEDEQSSLSQDAVRKAFNSPFRPFFLASTSIGQEGLDFHPWCHQLMHWNLPGNPVDLEQREGRVHRYDGHAVRKNVAALYAEKAQENWKLGKSLWKLMFTCAEQDGRERRDSDLVPHWITEGEHKVERVVPLLPFSKEQAQFDRLKRQLVAYRVVFGQPRQEELLSILDRPNIKAEQLSQLTIDLTPPETECID